MIEANFCIINVAYFFGSFICHFKVGRLAHVGYDDNSLGFIVLYSVLKASKVCRAIIKATVSLLNDDGSLGTKVEVKNVGSTKAALRSLRFELDLRERCSVGRPGVARSVCRGYEYLSR